MKTQTSWVAAAALMGLPLMAVAQANPADPVAAAPALEYQSAFSDYKPWGDIKQSDWRAINDAVRDAAPGAIHGGHGTPASAPPTASGHNPSAPEPTRAAPARQAPSGHHGPASHGGLQ